MDVPTIGQSEGASIRKEADEQLHRSVLQEKPRESADHPERQNVGTERGKDNPPAVSVFCSW